MHPLKVNRDQLSGLTDLPNIGPAGANDLRLLGYDQPEQLTGADPLQMYEALCAKTGVVHDPCVLDVFISVTRFMGGEAPMAWWACTAERKALLLSKTSAVSDRPAGLAAASGANDGKTRHHEGQ